MSDQLFNWSIQAWMYDTQLNFSKCGLQLLSDDGDKDEICLNQCHVPIPNSAPAYEPISDDESKLLIPVKADE
ncbi:unnamed protein product [Rotaria socialis]|uniref:Uncharacterized protein n=1 Tax=Rotaria socialis TaxID=392032 RepID=A0A821IWV8_9BILA|nr:unnamed protein product [Rotaria socialis]CAF4707762.1 unnamed protein product [Rotaria socialis]